VLDGLLIARPIADQDGKTARHGFDGSEAEVLLQGVGEGDEEIGGVVVEGLLGGRIVGVDVEARGEAVLLGELLKEGNLSGGIVTGEDEVGVGGRAFFSEAFEGGAEGEEEGLEVGFAGGVEATDVEGEEAGKRQAEGLPREPFLFGGGRMEVVGVDGIRDDFVAEREGQLARFGFQGVGDAGEDVELGLSGGLSGAERGVAGIKISEEEVEKSHPLNLSLTDTVLHPGHGYNSIPMGRADGGNALKIAVECMKSGEFVVTEMIAEIGEEVKCPVGEWIQATQLGTKGREGAPVGI
jgi:hypothetical protein